LSSKYLIQRFPRLIGAVGLLVDCCYPLAFKEFLEQLPAKDKAVPFFGR
jgi:hypothetical protein